MTLLQMHATAYGFPSTGTKTFFGRTSDNIPERLVPERKYYCKVFDMNCNKNHVEIQPSRNDILLGRGGKNNQHSGNEKLREFARVHAKKYNTSTKKGKSILSRILVKQMRELDPPARFLKKDQSSGRWEEAGEDTAREKASQVLRDAVAYLEGSGKANEVKIKTEPVDEVEPAPVPSAVDTSVHRRVGMPGEATPVLHSVTASWSSSTPTRSHESPDRNKRRRLTVLSPQGSNTLFSYPGYHDTILHSPVRVDPWQHAGHYTFPTMPHPARVSSQQSAPLSPPFLPYTSSQSNMHLGRQVASARRLSFGSRAMMDPLDPNFNDFDLFHDSFFESDCDEIVFPNQHPF